MAYAPRSKKQGPALLPLNASRKTRVNPLSEIGELAFNGSQPPIELGVLEPDHRLGLGEVGSDRLELPIGFLAEARDAFIEVDHISSDSFDLPVKTLGNYIEASAG